MRKPERDLWDKLFFDVAPLGPRRRTLLLGVIGVGILTFIVPLVTTDPPVAGMTRWSPFNMVWQMYQGKLHSPACERCGEPLIRSLLALPLVVTVAYLLLVFVLVALCFSCSTRVVISVALFGMYFILRGGWSVGTRIETQQTFYELRNGRVELGQVMVALLTVYGSLLFVVALEDLEPEPLPKKRQIGEQVRHAGQPDFLDAEIVPPQEEIKHRNAPPSLDDRVE